MELYKTDYSSLNRGMGKLDKVLLKCQDDSFYKLIQFLYVSHNQKAIVLKALYDRNLDIVLKFNYNNYSEKEFNTSNELLHLPNFLRYKCLIKCNDNIKNIINQKGNIMNYKMCHYGEDEVGILVMKYYRFGCVENYEWNENNFEILKNIIKQVIFAVIYAYKTKGFIHTDLHAGNVLLKPKRKDEIIYGDKKLEIKELEAVIIDFEKSKMNDCNLMRLFRDIDRFINNITCSNNISLYIKYEERITYNILEQSIENNFYDEIEKIIDNITIR